MKKLYAFLAFFIGCVSMVLGQQDTSKKMDPEVGKLYNKGVESLRASKFEDAVVYFDSCMLKTQDSKFNQQKGFALFKLKKYPEAVAQYQESIKLNPKNDAAYIQLARVYYDMKDYDNSIATNKKIMEIASDDQKKNDAEMMIANIQNELAIEFLRKGAELYKADKLEESVASLNKSLAIKKDYRAYYQLGLTYQKMKNSAEAIKMFQQTIAVNDTFVPAYSSIAAVNYADKKYAEAIADYEKTLTVAKSDVQKASIKEAMARSYFQLGAQFFTEKKYDKAIEPFTKSNELLENDKAVLFVARAQGEKKQWEAANASFDRALQIKKTITDGQVAYYRAMMYKNKGDNTKALEFFTLAAKDKDYKKFSDAEIDYIKKTAGQKK